MQYWDEDTTARTRDIGNVAIRVYGEIKETMASTSKDEPKSALPAVGECWPVQEVTEPNLYRETFSYQELPRAFFDQRSVPMDVPGDIWITDTTFRDGQQARAPYTI